MSAHTGFSPSERRRLKRLARPASSPDTALVQLGRLVESGGGAPLASMAPADLRILLQLLGGSAYLGDILIGEEDSWGDTFVHSIRTGPRTAKQHAAEFGAVAGEEAPAQFYRRLRRHKRRNSSASAPATSARWLRWKRPWGS